MNQMQQQDLMLRFSRCVFKHNANTYAEADCAGAAQIILRDFGGIALPENRLEWEPCFEMLTWPCDLQDLDVLFLQRDNQLGLIDHVGVHVGDGWIAHFGKRTNGMFIERVNRFVGKIIKIGRYKK